MIEIKGRIIHATDKAIQFIHEKDFTEVWIPKRLTQFDTTDPDVDASDFVGYDVTILVEEWFCIKHGWVS